MGKAKVKHIPPRAVDVVFYLIDPETKKVIGGEKFVTTIQLDRDGVAGAAMKLRTTDAIMKASETERRQDQTFREMIEALGITVSRKLAQTLKDWLHP